MVFLEKEKAKKRVLEEAGCKTLEKLNSLLSQKVEGIMFASGKGKHKTAVQKEWEALNHQRQQWDKHE